MKIVDRYLNILKDVKEAIIDAEYENKIDKILERKNGVEFGVEDCYLINESTGKYARVEIDEIAAYFRFEDDEYVEKNIYFRDFLRVSSYLHKSFGVSSKEAFQLLSLLTERNYLIAAKSPARTIVDHEALRRIKFKYVTVEEVENIFGNSELLRKFNTEDGLTEEEIIKRKEIQDHLDEFVQDYTEFCKINDAFYLGFVKVFPNINLESIINAINCLKKLNVNFAVIDSLTDYFISIFRTNLGRSTEIFDMEINGVYLSMLVSDEKLRKDMSDELIRHNTYVKKRLESEIESANKPKSEAVVLPTIKYLNEKDVRELKKFIRVFYDLYHAKLISLPNYQELLLVLEKMELLEEDFYAISRFLAIALNSIVNLDGYVSSYDELITLISYMIKYKIDRSVIDVIIRKYKSLKMQNPNLVIMMRDYLDEIRLYDSSLAEDVESLLLELDTVNEEDYDALIALLSECRDSMNKYSVKTDYEYNVALKNLGR